MEDMDTCQVLGTFFSESGVVLPEDEYRTPP